jgi:hypothetical protein
LNGENKTTMNSQVNVSRPNITKSFANKNLTEQRIFQGKIDDVFSSYDEGLENMG